MALPSVKIELQNGGLGKVSDLGNGTGALLVLMPTSPTGHAFGDVKEYASYSSLPVELQAVDGVKQYFNIAQGRTVAIMPIADTVSITDAVNSVHATPYMKQLVESNHDIRFAGVVGNGLAAADILTACTNAQVLAQNAAAVFAPVIVLLPYAYANADTVPDLTEATYNRVGVCVSQTGSEIGLLIGRLASIPVQRNIGRVKDGAMPVTNAALDNSTVPATMVESGTAQISSLHNKGYIALRTHIGKAGYYFTDDPLATDPTDDYSTIANRRVIDKAMVIAYKTYLNELLDEVEMTNGKLSAGVIKYLQAIVETAIGNIMLVGGEVSDVEAYIDENQNVLSTGIIRVQLKIVPVGYAKTIVVELGFDNPTA